MGSKAKSDGVGIFVAEKWVDSVVSVERHSERTLVQKMVYAILALLILEKASDMVPREVINWAMCKLGVGEVAEKGCQAWKLNK